MPKEKHPSESIYNLSNYLNTDKLLPIYFFFGEDGYTISNGIKAVVKSAEPLIKSDFDKETIEVDKGITLAHIMDAAAAFPFGGGKKLLIVKKFEEINERKGFAQYVNNPSDFTIMVVSQSGKKLDATKEPHLSLVKKGFLFEAHELRGPELNQWIIRKAKSFGLNISSENAWVLIDIIGDHKSLLDMNLQKINDYLVGKNSEITIEVIRELSSSTKDFTIFNLQDAIGEGNKKRALEIAQKLIDQGLDMVYIISMLTKFVTTVTQSMELSKQKMNQYEAAKSIGVSGFYYSRCAAAKFMKNFYRLKNAAQALLEADIMVKSTSMDSKTIVTILLTSMMS